RGEARAPHRRRTPVSCTAARGGLPLRRLPHRGRAAAGAMDPRRFRGVAAGLLAVLAAALAAAAARGDEQIAAAKLVVQSSPLAGFRHHGAAALWDELRIGDPLELLREPGNAYDANAVSVWWRGRKLGYVPRAQNAAIAWGLDRGERLRARISRLE